MKLPFPASQIQSTFFRLKKLLNSLSTTLNRKDIRVASKIENEGFGRVVDGFGVSAATERMVRTPQTLVIIDQLYK